jgi:tetratricopeptide (TPR) repeat protein
MDNADIQKSEPPKNIHRCRACQEPIQVNAKICPHCRSPQFYSRWRYFGTTIKWIGAITAVITLVTASIQVNKIVQSMLERNESVEELVRAADLLAESGDFAGALELIDQALELSPASRDARSLQVKVAMQRVRQFILIPDAKKLDFLETLLPILRRGSVHKDPSIAADTLAHLGWAYHLRGSGAQIVDNYFQKALTIDSENVFANAMWASFCLQRSSSRKRPVMCGKTSEEVVNAAKKHYQVALKSKQMREYLKGIIFRSLFDAPGSSLSEPRLEAIRFADQIRRQNENLSDKVKSECLHYLILIVADEDGLKNLVQKVPPDDLLKNLEWLTKGKAKIRIKHEATAARLLEISGKTDTALAKYRKLRIRVRKERIRIGFGSDNLDSYIDKAIVRALPIHRGSLGMNLTWITPKVAQSFGLTEGYGALVEAVSRQGAAARAGIEPGDVIVAIDDVPAEDKMRFVSTVQKSIAGEIVTMTVIRRGEKINYKITLEPAKIGEHVIESVRRRYASEVFATLVNKALYQSSNIKIRNGYTLQMANPTDELRQGYGIPDDVQGPVVLEQYYSGQENIFPGVVIISVGEHKITSAEQFKQIVESTRLDGKESILLTLFNQNKREYGTLKLK